MIFVPVRPAVGPSDIGLPGMMLAAGAEKSTTEEPSMMFPGWGMGGWMMAAYGLMRLLLLAAGVVAVIAISRRMGSSGNTARPTATELLAQRYAPGGIDDEEYLQRVSVLDSTCTPTHLGDRAR